MRSQFVRSMMGIGLLFLCAGPVLSQQPDCAIQLNRWSHNLRHDWDGDGTPENRGVWCVFYGAETGWEYAPIFDPPNPPDFCVCPDNHRTDAGNPYHHVHLNHSFPLLGLVIINGNPVWVTVTASMKEAFYDWYYRDGYTKVGTYSVSQNCYGYAFGTGTFVNDGTYGADTILADDWEDADEEDVEVFHKFNHAIKVTPKMCEDEQASWYIIQKSSEKNRCSAIYEKTGDCPDGVTVMGGSYSGYKKKTP